MEKANFADRFCYKAYRILYFGFIVLPLIAGIDKFTDLLTDWDKYLSPLISNVVNAHTFLMIVGVVEIAAALIVAFRPMLGAAIVAFWLWGIVLNLLTMPGFYDIALRDFGLSLGALALAHLAREYQSL
ncbi:MAG: hypothetical protein NUV91_02605 [Candidatus Omnitrophica bacterium]|nr:hypothetical protein [Candidatus Omnitrophota bacterium]